MELKQRDYFFSENERMLMMLFLFTCSCRADEKAAANKGVIEIHISIDYQIIKRTWISFYMNFSFCRLFFLV